MLPEPLPHRSLAAQALSWNNSNVTLHLLTTSFTLTGLKSSHAVTASTQGSLLQPAKHNHLRREAELHQPAQDSVSEQTAESCALL